MAYKHSLVGIFNVISFFSVPFHVLIIVVTVTDGLLTLPVYLSALTLTLGLNGDVTNITKILVGR